MRSSTATKNGGRDPITPSVSFRPWFPPSEQLWELYVKHAKFIVPGVLKYPELKAAFLLEIPTYGTEGFKSFHFGFKVVGFNVNMHTFFRKFLISGGLQQESDGGVRKLKTAVNVTALFGKGFFGGAECCRPEHHALV